VIPYSNENRKLIDGGDVPMGWHGWHRSLGWEQSSWRRTSTQQSAHWPRPLFSIR